MSPVPAVLALGRSVFLALSVALVSPGAGQAQVAAAPPGILPIEDVSPMFLGMYRKVMEIEAEIKRYAEQYGVDFDLARAVCLYESGGNAGLSSGAGAQGYFQVMPATFRSLGVSSNIEAGVKYLAQMIHRFDREDSAIAAYNGGPGRIGRGGGLPLETLQYVLGVGQYRTVLKSHDASLRHHATSMRLTAVQDGDDWLRLSSRLGVPEWELRLHNAFLSQRRLRAGQLIAYAAEPRADLFGAVDGAAEYRMRYGDNYLNLAFTLGIDPDALRDANGLWHLQSVPVGFRLRIPLTADRSGLLRAALEVSPSNAREQAVVASTTVEPAPPVVADPVAATPPPPPPPARVAAPPSPPPPTAAPPAVSHRVARGDTLGGLARLYGTTVGALQQANGMARRTTIHVGELLMVPGATGARAIARAPQKIVHRVSRGDTLAGLARRYGTTVRALQQANGLSARRTTIRVGQRLEVPGAAGARAPSMIVHRVSRGDTLTDLARRYGTTIAAIQQANGMARRTVIRTGERLQIPVSAAAE